MKRILSTILAAVAVAAAAPTLAATPLHWPVTYTEPYLVAPSPSRSMNVLWLTSEPGTRSWVEYGLDSGYGRVAETRTHEITGLRQWDATSGSYPVSLRAYQQVARIDDLEPGTRYFYRVVTETPAGRFVGAGYDFRTAPRRGEPVKFLLLSDLQLKNQGPATLALAGRQGVDFIVYSGDLQNTPYKADEWFKTRGAANNPDGLRWFEEMQQTTDGTRLLQYTPIYPAPGNHEVDGQERLSKKGLVDMKEVSLGIYEQLFRPLYPDQQPYAGGKHWYGADFGDVDVASLSLFRAFGWDAYDPPGWLLLDGIQAGSPQHDWLAGDLQRAHGAGRYIWVTQHWHMLNRRSDVAVPFSQPVIDLAGKVTYPRDDLTLDLMPLYQYYGVNGVSFGHSHVYERYTVKGVHYIEAASLGTNYWSPADPPVSPNLGIAPDFEENCFRSFVVVSTDPWRGMTAEAFVASGPDYDPSWGADRVQACRDHLAKVSYPMIPGSVFDRFTLSGPRSPPRGHRGGEGQGD